MDLDPVDFFPGYNPQHCIPSQRDRRQDSCSSLWIHLISLSLSVIICTAGFYYYEVAGKGILENIHSKQQKLDPIEELRQEIKLLKARIDQTDIQRIYLEDFYTKMTNKQESAHQKKIEELLDLYDSDKIGLFDYAAIYSSGSIHSTPDTTPYPINKTINIFNLVKMNVLSNPENLLQPSNVPGDCFAYTGSIGRIRIKLGKRITIRAVSIDHIRLNEGKGSTPKDFEVYGLIDPNDEDSGMLLGKFSYDINGRPVQTFKIHKNKIFDYVELRILNNYGKEYTCVYRFRVHDINEVNV